MQVYLNLFIIKIEMGSDCSLVAPFGQLPETSCKSPNFIEKCWGLLRVNGKLNSLSPIQQKIFQSKLISLQMQNSKEGQLSLNDQGLIVRYSRSTCLYLGKAINGKINDPTGSIAYLNGKIFSGEIKDNKVSGYGEIKFPFTNNKAVNLCKFEGRLGDSIEGYLYINKNENHHYLELSKDKLTKSQIKFIEYPNFDTYVGETKDGKAHGEGKFVYRSGDSLNNFPYYEGAFSNGLRHGKGTFHYDESISLTIDWKKGKPEGTGSLKIERLNQTVFYSNGRRIISRPSLVESLEQN